LSRPAAFGALAVLRDRALTLSDVRGPAVYAHLLP
jgi:hypothetical protein